MGNMPFERGSKSLPQDTTGFSQAGRAGRCSRPQRLPFPGQAALAGEDERNRHRINRPTVFSSLNLVHPARSSKCAAGYAVSTPATFFASARFSTTVKVVPWPRAMRTSMRPPISEISMRHSPKPRPVPPESARVVKNGSKIFSRLTRQCPPPCRSRRWPPSPSGLRPCGPGRSCAR